jgi:hypothetical protein
MKWWGYPSGVQDSYGGIGGTGVNCPVKMVDD